MDRYGIRLTEFGDWDEHKDPDGEWVKYSDVKELEEERGKLIKLVRDGMARMERYGEFARFHKIKKELNELLTDKGE